MAGNSLRSWWASKLAAQVVRASLPALAESTHIMPQRLSSAGFQCREKFFVLVASRLKKDGNEGVQPPHQLSIRDKEIRSGFPFADQEAKHLPF